MFSNKNLLTGFDCTNKNPNEAPNTNDYHEAHIAGIKHAAEGMALPSIAELALLYPNPQLRDEFKKTYYGKVEMMCRESINQAMKEGELAASDSILINDEALIKKYRFASAVSAYKLFFYRKMVEFNIVQPLQDYIAQINPLPGNSNHPLIENSIHEENVKAQFFYDFLLNHPEGKLIFRAYLNAELDAQYHIPLAQDSELLALYRNLLAVEVYKTSYQNKKDKLLYNQMVERAAQEGYEAGLQKIKKPSRRILEEKYPHPNALAAFEKHFLNAKKLMKRAYDNAYTMVLRGNKPLNHTQLRLLYNQPRAIQHYLDTFYATCERRGLLISQSINEDTSSNDEHRMPNDDVNFEHVPMEVDEDLELSDDSTEEDPNLINQPPTYVKCYSLSFLKENEEINQQIMPPGNLKALPCNKRG